MSTQIEDEFIACGDWLPDQPDYNNPGCNEAQNVVPRTGKTYSPMPAFLPVSTTPLVSKPLGAFSARDASGNPGTYAGTAAKLYAATNGTKPNFVDASATVYSTALTGFWSFTEGDGFVYATNGTDAIQRVTTGTTGPFAPLGANTPKAAVIAAIQPGYLLCGDINDVTVGIQPQGIRWSALGDFTDFPLIGSTDATTKESDWQKVSGPHGRLMNIAPDLSTCNAALFFEEAVFRMVFTGGDKIFDIQPVEKLRGTPARRSLLQVGQVVYYLGHDGFYSFDGTVSTPIGAGKVNTFFYKDCDPNYISEVQAVADPRSGLCFWLYAGQGNKNGLPNRILVFNSIFNRFSQVVSFSGHSLFLGLSFGTSLDAIDALGFNLDNLPFSLDSPILAGGNLLLGGFDDTNTLGFFSGDNMAFQVDTTETQLIHGRSARVNAVRPIVEGDIVSAAVAGRKTVNAPVVFGSANPPDSQGRCSARNESRYHRVRLIGEAGNTAVHISGAEVEFTAGGRR